MINYKAEQITCQSWIAYPNISLLEDNDEESIKTEYDKTILIKFNRTNLLFNTSENVVCTGHLNKPLTKIKGRPFWCIDDGTTDRIVITGWRYIHE